MSEKWTRSGQCFHKDGGAWWDIDYVGDPKRDKAQARNADFDEMQADASYGAAIREFAQAAEAILRRLTRALGDGRLRDIRVEGIQIQGATDTALALLPAAEPASKARAKAATLYDPATEAVAMLRDICAELGGKAKQSPEPAPTLAEQGEEIKDLIDETFLNARRHYGVMFDSIGEQRDRLKGMVDALVAGHK